MKTESLQASGFRLQAARGASLVLLAGLVVTTGCQSGPKINEPIRAVWVTRMDYKTPEDIVQIMDNCATAKFNTVVFQVRGNGTVFYPSKIEPWAEKYDFTDPGYDPLQIAIDEAHKRDMELHAWVNVMPAWQGPGEPADPKQLYHAHPNWFWYDKDGNRQPTYHEVNGQKREWYVSLNPCLPEVRSYLVDVFKEIVKNYKVDGLHLDYIRFPNEPVVRGEVIPDYPRDARTLELFKRDTGHTPESNPEAWNQWRTDKVNQLVADIHDMMRRTDSKKVLSVSAGSVRGNALRYYQDAEQWMTSGTVDVVYLMNYTPDVDEFNNRIQPWLTVESDAALVPGLILRDQDTVEEEVDTARRQIEIAREHTGNFCVFAYSSLFERSRPGEQARPAQSDRRQRRAERSEQLVEYLQSLADQSAKTM